MRKRRHKQFYFMIILSIFVFSSLIHSSANVSLNQEDTITYALPYGFNEFSSQHMNSYSSAQWMSSVYAGLMERSQSANYNWKPDLAADYPDVSNDGLVYSFNLKKDLMFSNGEDLTSEDIEFSLKVAVTPDINVAGYAAYLGYLDNDSMEIESPTSFSITLLQAFQYPYSLLSFPIIPKDYFNDRYNSCVYGVKVDCIWNSPNGSDAISAGPFMVESVSNTLVSLKANLNWYDADEVKTDQIIFKEILFKDEAIAGYKAGEVDILDPQYNLNHNDVDEIESISELKIADSTVSMLCINHNHPYLGTGALIPNSVGVTNESQIFENARLLRQAMSLVIPRESYANALENSYTIPATTMMPFGLIGWDEDLQYQEYDVVTAKTIMENIGFNFNSLGTPSSEGLYSTYFFDISLIYRDNQPSFFSYDDFASQLAKIGIGVNLEALGGTEYYSRIFVENGEIYGNGGFDVAPFFSPINFGPYWDPSFFFDSEPADNWLNFDEDGSMTGVAQAVEDYLAEENYDEKVNQVKNLQKLVQYWLPTIPTVNMITYWAWKSDVHGVDNFLISTSSQEWELVEKDGFKLNVEVDEDNSLLDLPDNIGVVFVSIAFLSTVVGVGIFLKKGSGVISDPLTVDNQKSIISEIFKSRTYLYYYLIGQNTSENVKNEEIEQAIPQDIYKFKFLLNPVRLSMMKLLNDITSLTTIEIKETLNLSWNDVKTHLSALKEKNYVVSEHQFIDGSRKQVVSITSQGSEKIQILMNLLHIFLDSTVDIEIEKFD